MTTKAKTAKPKPAPMLRRKDLKARGWTNKLVKDFASQPDATKPNPMRRSGPPIWLWHPMTIEAIEVTPEFRAARAIATTRKHAAAKGTATKIAAMEAWVDGLEIELPDVDLAELIWLAIRSFNNRGLDRLCEGRVDHFREASESSDPAFLRRITVNFVRHAETGYEQHLNDTFGKVGTGVAYGRLKAKILDAIGAKWPELRDECERQKERTI